MRVNVVTEADDWDEFQHRARSVGQDPARVMGDLIRWYLRISPPPARPVTVDAEAVAYTGDIDDLALTRLRLPTLLNNQLARRGIFTLGDLLSHDRATIGAIVGVGPTSMAILDATLTTYQLTWE